MILPHHLPGHQGAGQGTVALARLAPAAAQHVARGPAHGLARRPAGQRLRGRVDGEDATLRVEAQQPVGHRPDDALQPAALVRDFAEQPGVVERGGRVVGQRGQRQQVLPIERGGPAALRDDDPERPLTAADRRHQPRPRGRKSARDGEVSHGVQGRALERRRGPDERLNRSSIQRPAARLPDRRLRGDLSGREPGLGAGDLQRTVQRQADDAGRIQRRVQVAAGALDRGELRRPAGQRPVGARQQPGLFQRPGARGQQFGQPVEVAAAERPAAAVKQHQDGQERPVARGQGLGEQRTRAGGGVRGARLEARVGVQVVDQLRACLARRSTAPASAGHRLPGGAAAAAAPSLSRPPSRHPPGCAAAGPPRVRR